MSVRSRNKHLSTLFRPHISLMLISLVILTTHILHEKTLYTQLFLESVFQYSVSMSFNTDSDVSVSTYLPDNNNRTEILNETITSANYELEFLKSPEGRYAQWSSNTGHKSIIYRALVSLKETHFNISENVRIPSTYEDGLAASLNSTAAIPVNHVEIKALWAQIKPLDTTSSLAVLKAIYNYTHDEIRTLPFKGFTDSLTALRLNAASCNGKSRLFSSLARLNNLPTRLVGGVVLNGEKKKTSHQWVEVFIQENWVPFDPTNGHFAKLPSHYLALYRGDQHLFKHTSNINFDYAFTSKKINIAPALYRSTSSSDSFFPNSVALLQSLGLPLKTSYIFLLFPICTLLITFLRNIVGIKTIGIFMPMLIAAASVYTGFFTGLVGFSLVLLLAFIGHTILGQFKILKIPRLAAIITITTIVSLIAIASTDVPQNIEFGLLMLFPVVIISFAADRIHQMTNESSWQELWQNSIGTLFTLSLCYLVFTSFLLQGLFSLYPELLITTLAVQLFIGSWSGMRISELIRFQTLIGNTEKQVLSINGRNRDLIYTHNSPALLQLATDKLKTKECLSQAGIPCPDTLGVCQRFGDIQSFIDDSLMCNEHFALKPNKGARGNGILLLNERKGTSFTSTSGKNWPRTAIKQHIEEILSGSFSQSGTTDSAYLEPLIQQEESLKTISPLGLCDIRIIVSNGQLLSAMLRVPTVKSQGKANLHKGAVGTSIDLPTGITGRSLLEGSIIQKHPDNGTSLQGIQLPHWVAIKQIALQCYQAIPLGYMGVDICIDEQKGPLVLEVNGRPGLEIQNINNQGMHAAALGAF
ncbi:MAG: UUP1 family membrane protein [Cycloclasticus sp.]|nr:UUP1 family membrane protein [Cycloclasticus sp.]